MLFRSNDTATTEIYTACYTLSLHDALPISDKEMAPALAPPDTANGAPLQIPDGAMAPRYGFGWFLDTYKGHRRYAHYGETVGFRTAIQRFPDDGLTVIVIANRSEVDAPALAQSVAGLYLESR